MLPKSEWEKTLAWSRVVAGCVIANDVGQYLLVQEAQPKVYGLWNMPAGHVDKGESIEHSAVREALEETGYNIELLSKIGVYHDAVEEPIRHVFSARIIGGQLTPQPGEILDADWFSYSDITAMKQSEKLRADWIYRAITQAEDSRKFNT